MTVSIKELFTKLLKHYGSQNWWPAETHYEVMLGAVLTQNTNWKNVELAIDNLDGTLEPDYIHNIEIDQLRELIRPSGFYNQKAQCLKDLTAWFYKYDFSVDNIKSQDMPKIRRELLEIKRIGHETADSILLYAFDSPVFIIDSYTRRIFNRVGLNTPRKYDDFRLLIEDGLRQSECLVDLYKEYHGLLVTHAKEACLKKPKCQKCGVNQYCAMYIKANS